MGLSSDVGTPGVWGSVPPHPAHPGAAGTAEDSPSEGSGREVVSSLQSPLTGESWVTPGTPILERGYQVVVRFLASP